MFKAAIFDMDGVMVDNHHFHVEAWELFCQRYGIHFTEDDFRARYFGKNNFDILSGLMNRAVTNQEVELLGEEKESIYREVYKDHIQPVKELIGLLESLKSKGIKMAVATSAPRTNLDFVLENLNIRGYFDVIVDAHMINKGKPDPEIYLKASELLHIPPSECVVFEDSISGIKSGQAAGMRVIALVTTHKIHELPKTELAIYDFTELNTDDITRLFI